MGRGFLFFFFAFRGWCGLEQGPLSKEHGAKSKEQGAWSKEQGARGKGHGARWWFVITGLLSAEGGQ